MIRKIIILVLINSYILFLWLIPFVFAREFIYHGDFAFKTSFDHYLSGSRYLWNEVNGSLALDMNIRFFSRLPFLIFYSIIRSNILFSYFFIFFNLIVLYGGGYVFLRFIIKLKHSPSFILALLFIANPVFLGNFSKLGLVYGVMLLPFIIYCIQKYHKNHVFVWLVIANILLNFSFVHPFTFLVNAVVAVIIFFGYFYFSKKSRLVVVLDVIKSCVIALLLNIYYLLPLLQIQSLDKMNISRSSGSSGEENALLGIANTKNLAESVSFSKSVFVEYRFFNEEWMYVLYIFYFIFFGVLFYGLHKYSRLFSDRDRKLSFFNLIILCITFLLVGGSCFDFMVDVYGLLYELPIGWAFRSPLKWQLYQPLLFFGIIGILFKYWSVFQLRYRRIFNVGIILLLLSNTLTLYDIYNNLLVPQDYSIQLHQSSFQGKRVVVQNDIPCRKEINEYRPYFDELKHLFINNAKSFKVLNDQNLYNNIIYFKNFDFVVVCQKPSAIILQDFNIFYHHEEPYYYILEHKDSSRPDVHSVPHVFGVNQYLDTIDFDSFVDQDDRPSVGEGIGADFIDVFEMDYIYSPIDIRDYKKTIDSGRNVELYYTYNQNNKLSLYYRHNGVLKVGEDIVFDNNSVLFLEDVLDYDSIYLDETQYPLLEGDYSLGNHNIEDLMIKYVKDGIMIESRLATDAYSLDNYDVYNHKIKLITNRYSPNLITNPSFEYGMWHPEVFDCYNYDNFPQLKMSIDSEFSTQGNQSLKISSVRHTACTLQEFKVSPNYALHYSFDVFSQDGLIDYSFVFNNEEKTTYNRREHITSSQNLEGYVSVPKDATSVRMFLKTPQLDLYKINEVSMDNFVVYQEPPRTQMYYYESLEGDKPSYITNLQKHNPTHYTFTVGAKKDAYIILQQDFNKHWTLYANGREVGNHFKYNYLYNAWYLNVAEFCSTLEQYQIDEDGNYLLDLELVFKPQLEYDIGLKITWISFVIVISYCLFHVYKSSRDKD